MKTKDAFLQTSALVAAAVIFFDCNKSVTGPEAVASGPFSLVTTESSAVAGITRVPDKQAYAKGDTVAISAAPSGGYSFAGWSGDTAAGGETLKIVMQKDMTVYANFLNAATGKKVFSLTVEAENGSVLFSPPGGVYDSGTTVSLSAAPDYGFTFSGWSGKLSGKEAAGVVTIGGNSEVIATFTEDPAAAFSVLHVSPATLHGTIEVIPQGAKTADGWKFKPGTTVKIIAAPETGYELGAWGGDFSQQLKTVASLDVVMDGVRTVSATFTKIPRGQKWTSRTSGVSAKLLGVVWTGSSAGTGGGQLVAVGKGGTIITSPDAETWTVRTSGKTSDLNSIVWTGSQLVAVGASGTVLTSPDGITWTSRSPGTTNALQSVAWTGSQLVAVGGYYENTDFSYEAMARVITSPDGIAWTDRTTTELEGIWNGIVWTGSKLYAVGFHQNMMQLAGTGGMVGNYSSPKIYSSADGAAWTEVYDQGVYDIDYRAIGWSGASLVVVGRPTGTASTPYTPFVTSSDGKTWESDDWPSETGLYGITWTGDEFVIVGDEGSILIVTGEMNRKWPDPITTRSLYGVAWTGSRLVAVGDYGTVLTSP